MKILEVYDKNDRDILISDGLVVLDEIEKYLDKFPSECRKNYDKNLETVSFRYVDQMYCGNYIGGIYLNTCNIILFKNFNSLVHELVHMASYDKVSECLGFSKKDVSFEVGLLEGMTELIACKCMNLQKPSGYPFQVFAASMLSMEDDIFIPFFKALPDEFINFFPNEKDILSLMYSLDYYQDNIFNEDADLKILKSSIRNVIDALIKIELSYNPLEYRFKIYREKFMDLLSSSWCSDMIKDIDKNYINYAHNELKKNIKTRKRVKIEVSSK